MMYNLKINFLQNICNFKDITKSDIMTVRYNVNMSSTM